MLNKIVNVNQKQLSIIKELLPGPFTIILKSKNKVIPLLQSEKNTLGVRIPDYWFINELVRKFNKPITATSANLSNKTPHYQLKTLLNHLASSKIGLIDLIIDGGKLPRNKPSTVVDLTESNIKLLRHGDILLKNKNIYISQSVEETKQIASLIIKIFLHNIKIKPLVVIIKGELGVGKTIFVKGIGNLLGVNNIISPSYVVCYEYKVIHQYINMMLHFDLYNVNEKEEFQYLNLNKYLRKGNIMCFEWGEKAGDIINLLKQKARVVYINMEYLNKTKREIIISS